MFALGDAKLLTTWPNGRSGGDWEYPTVYWWDKVITGDKISKVMQHRGYNMLFADGHAQQLRACLKKQFRGRIKRGGGFEFVS
jgi:prepilin-type processing-associated H-X9-DG protein